MYTYYYSKGKVYGLNKKQTEELKTTYPTPEYMWSDYVAFIEENGKLIGDCEMLDP